MKNSLTIGIPIRNEEESILIFTEYLKKALDVLKIEFPDLLIEVLFCLNGTTDKSAQILDSILFNEYLKNTKIIYSKQGKINALLEIVKNRIFPTGYICFIDADVKLDEFCIVNLFKDLKLNRKVFLTYSSVYPEQNRTKNFIQIIQQSHYSLRDNVIPRKYFHGRAYMMRSAIFLCESPRKSLSPYWNLSDGPYVDDIYLSRLIVHSYGLSSIKENKKAKLFFLPPKNINDFYLGQRRLMFEIKRLNLLYPEHSYIQKMFFRKKVNWAHFLDVNNKYLFLYFLYHILEESIRFVVRLEILMISLHVMKCKNIWKPLKTTKRWIK